MTTEALVKRLRKYALTLKAGGFPGIHDDYVEAADALEAQARQLNDPGATHAEGCETWGPKHWGCALAKIDAQAREIESTRRALEQAFPTDDGFTEAFDQLVHVGLIVPVPADEAFRAEWGEDEETMWVWRWHPLSTPSTPEEASDE